MNGDRNEERFFRGNGFCLVKIGKLLPSGTICVPYPRSLGAARQTVTPMLQCSINVRWLDSRDSRVSVSE